MKDKEEVFDEINEEISGDTYDQLVQFLAAKLAPALKIKDFEKFLAEARNLDNDLKRNKTTFHLNQWAMDKPPICAAEQFVIVRSWQRELIKEDAQYQGRKPIVIDPGIAFGWAHPTTLVTLELLEKYWQGGRMLDVGTGSAVVAIAAAILHPEAHIDAFDISLDIVEEAQNHLQINRLADKSNINLRQGDITDYEPYSYDLITANLLPSIFIKIKDELIKRLKPGGLLIISGFSDQNEICTSVNFDWAPMTTDISQEKVYIMRELFENAGLELIDQRGMAFDKEEPKLSVKNPKWLGLAMRMPVTDKVSTTDETALKDEVLTPDKISSINEVADMADKAPTTEKEEA